MSTLHSKRSHQHVSKSGSMGFYVWLALARERKDMTLKEIDRGIEKERERERGRERENEGGRERGRERDRDRA
jgi:hypothetical protein